MSTPPPRARLAPPRRLARLTAAVAVLVGLTVMMPGEALARYASIVVDAASGRILHARDVDNRLYPASMTKMMTLYLLFEAIDTGRLSMESRLHVSTRAAGQPPSKLGLRAGSTIAVKDAIRALVTKSANDVATVVAEALGSTEVNFARLMTQKARDLGMRRTSFRNASGLPNSGQKSTARDMAVLAMSLMQHFPHHYHFFSTTAFRYNGRTYGTHNNLMKRYPGADGLKTGYIRASGFNVAFSATRAGRRLVAVVFGGRSARSRDDHMAELMDKGFRLVTQASYSPYATGQRVRVVARPDLPSGVTPLPPALPPGKMGETRVAGLSTVIPRVISSLLDQPKPAASAHVTPVPPAAPGGAGAAGGTETVQGSARGATTTAALDTGPDQGGTWGVQVGAFSSLNAAERAAHDAARLLRDGPAPIRVRVIPHTVADGKLYRARLLGMGTESQARAACRDLRARERSCLVVVPTGWTVAAR